MQKFWPDEFHDQTEQAHDAKAEGLRPVSITIRVRSGYFDRKHSPRAYRLIDDGVGQTDLSDLTREISERENGLEILVYAEITPAGPALDGRVIGIIVALVRARAGGIEKGDPPSPPLELIVHGQRKEGESYEEATLRMPLETLVSAPDIEAAIARKFASVKQR